MSIKGEQQALFIALDARLQLFERVFGYKERPLHRAVVSPEPDRTSGLIKDSALVWEIEHWPQRLLQSALEIQHFRRPSESRTHQ